MDSGFISSAMKMGGGEFPPPFQGSRGWESYLGLRLRLHPRLYSHRRFAAQGIRGLGGHRCGAGYT